MSPPHRSSGSEGDADAGEVLAAVARCWAAFDEPEGDPAAHFTEDATVFALSVSPRLEGRESYRRVLGQRPSGERRKTHILHPEVRLLGGGAALVSFHSRSRVNFRCADYRATLLLLRQGNELKIAHFHLSPLYSPFPTETPGLIEEILRLPPRKEASPP